MDLGERSIAAVVFSEIVGSTAQVMNRVEGGPGEATS
jgi:hypothetical protein